MENERARRLQDGLRRQREIYRVLMKLTERQRDCYTEGEADEVVRLARAKEDELERIAAINVEIDEYKQSWRECRDSVEESLRDQVEEEMNGLGGLLRELITLEAETENLIRDGQERQAESLRKIEGSRRMQKAYGGPGANPRLMDRSR